jgi:hypothetical protein
MEMLPVAVAFDFVASSDDGLGLGEAVGALVLGFGGLAWG